MCFHSSQRAAIDIIEDQIIGCERMLAIIFTTCVAGFGELLDEPLHDARPASARLHKMLVAEKLVAQKARQDIGATKGSPFFRRDVARHLSETSLRLLAHLR